MFNCVELTKAMLESLEETVDLRQDEVILVDDASTDGTNDFLLSLKSPYKVFRNETNLGFAKSNNLGTKQATGKLIVFLNNDLVLKPNWLEPILAVLEAESDVGIVGNIQLNHKTGLVDHAGIFFDLEGMPTHAWKTRKRPPSGEYRERNAVTAACAAVRKEVFEEMGGFDEGYLNGMEDVDLCVRLKQHGFRNFVSHQSIVLHHVSMSPGRHENNEANSRRFREKWTTTTSKLGTEEWPKEYLARYARYWWRMEPSKFARAMLMLLLPSNRKG